jgi:hypothetical protein
MHSVFGKQSSKWRLPLTVPQGHGHDEAVGNKIRLNSQGWKTPDRWRSAGRDCGGVKGAAPSPGRAPPGYENIDAGRAGRLRMSNALRPEGNGVPSGGTGVLGNGNGVSLDEDTMTFGKHESSPEGKRRVSTTRVREFRKRQKLRLVQRTIRISPD